MVDGGPGQPRVSSLLHPLGVLPFPRTPPPAAWAFSRTLSSLIGRLESPVSHARLGLDFAYPSVYLSLCLDIGRTGAPAACASPHPRQRPCGDVLSETHLSNSFLAFSNLFSSFLRAASDAAASGAHDTTTHRRHHARCSQPCQCWNASAPGEGGLPREAAGRGARGGAGTPSPCSLAARSRASTCGSSSFQM